MLWNLAGPVHFGMICPFYFFFKNSRDIPTGFLIFACSMLNKRRYLTFILFFFFFACLFSGFYLHILPSLSAQQGIIYSSIHGFLSRRISRCKCIAPVITWRPFRSMLVQAFDIYNKQHFATVYAFCMETSEIQLQCLCFVQCTFYRNIRLLAG